MLNENAPAGKEMKYARVELERRFLLAALPAQPSVRDVHILDRYLIGTRLRLRRVTDDGAGGGVVHKLTQKVPGSTGGPGLITTMYLSEEEYDALAAIPASVLRKVRHSVPPFGVDEFQGVLSGLFLAEAEFETDEECAAFAAPTFAVAEVTGDPRFSGGRLVKAGRDEVSSALTDYGLTVGLPG